MRNMVNFVSRLIDEEFVVFAKKLITESKLQETYDGEKFWLARYFWGVGFGEGDKTGEEFMELAGLKRNKGKGSEERCGYVDEDGNFYYWTRLSRPY